MTEESIAFEKLNSRIEKLRQTTKATVKWNAHIPDPDDPNESRQIDVLIQNGSLRTGVECRLRDGVQSVMWVEELIGRKQSLQLDGMIGVAVNGFSKLAQKKAQHHGIVLYDFRTLTDAEIASWAGAATVDATFVQFDPLVIVAGVAQSDAARLPTNVTFQHNQKDGYSVVMDMVRDDAASNQGIQRHISLNTSGFNIHGVPVTILNVGFIAHTVAISSTCTAVQAVDTPGTPVLQRDITVQRFDHTVSEVIRKQDDVHLVVDVSKLQPPPNSILHEMRIAFPSTVTLRGYELVGERRMLTRATSVMLEVFTTT